MPRPANGWRRHAPLTIITVSAFFLICFNIYIAERHTTIIRRGDDAHYISLPAASSLSSRRASNGDAVPPPKAASMNDAGREQDENGAAAIDPRNMGRILPRKSASARTAHDGGAAPPSQAPMTTEERLASLRMQQDSPSETSSGPGAKFSCSAVPRLPVMSKPSPFPPLEALVSSDEPPDGELTGDVSYLLDWAVIGFAKCGTSTLREWIGTTNETAVLLGERCDLARNRTVKLVRGLHHDLVTGLEEDGGDIYSVQRGIKCPQDAELARFSLRNYATLFPKTKLIVGVRHPVLWFESLYNFRIRAGKDMLPPNNLIDCVWRSQQVCTSRARFHLFLGALSKTPMTDVDETGLLFTNEYEENRCKRINSPNPVFFYEMGQLINKDAEETDLARQFRRDLSCFLGLENELPPMPHKNAGKDSFTGKDTFDENSNKTIRICDEEHSDVREVLMDIARRSSQWFRNYFLKSDEVFVSSREHLVYLLEQWMHDPCELLATA